MSLSPDRYPAPSESFLSLSLGLQLGQQFTIAPEARRARRQVFCDCWAAFCWVERKRSERNIRWASLTVRVGKSLREIRARKIKQVLTLSLKASAVFEVHFHRSQPLIKLSRFITHFSGQAPRQSCAAPR